MNRRCAVMACAAAALGLMLDAAGAWAQGWRGHRLVIPLDPAAKGPPLLRVSGPKGRPLVVIDAGHGGHDPGTLSAGDGLPEKALTLAVAKRLRDTLLASGRVRVALTRETDQFLVLR